MRVRFGATLEKTTKYSNNAEQMMVELPNITPNRRISIFSAINLSSVNEGLLLCLPISSFA